MHSQADNIVAAARAYLGTPFQHQGRLRGIAVDCIGLLMGVAQELGLYSPDNTTYSRQPDGQMLLAELRARYVEIPIKQRAKGDILVFWVSRTRRFPQHVGFATDVGLLHTYQHVGRVVEHGFDVRWLKKLCYVFRFKE